MAESKLIDAVLTDDETQLVTIINGLEKQAKQLETDIRKLKVPRRLLMLGSVASVGLVIKDKSILENVDDFSVGAGMFFGLIKMYRHELKLMRHIRSKSILANHLKGELEPTDLERYEETKSLYFEDEEDQ